MILPEHKALFVHVPKAAGQSVENFLLQSLNKDRKADGPDYLLRPNNNPAKGPKRLAHLTALDYVKYEYLSPKEFDDYFKFSIVRNPWSRMVSFYKFRGFSNLTSFNTFVSKYLPKYFEDEHWFFRPQTDFIFNEEDKLVVDFMGRLEQLDTDFSKIAQQLSVPFTKLPKSNHSIEKGLISRKSYNLIRKHPGIIKYISSSPKNNKKYKEMYNDTSRKIVENLYQKDIELLGYTF
ncbi:sulfotransferase family 2 domain-containing protein [Marixanthomonas ophiurae]|uniref:Sulfotransferase family protein n=1 Tax=Marixanthomonas ophiurae TaxID=387659 RepID=A0A3E1Q764_9FLAO|nr:sulfotransferase family 2 domain-containing protein [Marixanthomonas ophiurae]RFN57971.1 hypothetical protein DZ858_12065 [Marixanthomonas ophiurae]